MQMEHPDEHDKNRHDQLRFINAIRGLGNEYIDKVAPDCVKILVNECNSLGETLGDA